MSKDSNGHTWKVDEDGVCEYDQGYRCACGARKVVMAEGDSHLDDKAGKAVSQSVRILPPHLLG